MVQIEIQRYGYGKTPRYTAFCLVNWMEPKPRVLPTGETVMSGNGPSAVGTKHFESLETLLEYAQKQGMLEKIRNFPEYSDGLSINHLLDGTRARAKH